MYIIRFTHKIIFPENVIIEKSFKLLLKIKIIHMSQVNTSDKKQLSTPEIRS